MIFNIKLVACIILSEELAVTALEFVEAEKFFFFKNR